MAMPTNNNKPTPLPALPEADLLACFDQRAQHQARAPAQTFAAQQYSYGDLSRAAAGLAQALRAEGVGPGDKLAVGVSRSASLLPLLLAIWSLRASYIPVDPAYPLSRQAYILKDAGVTLLVCDAAPADLAFSGKSVTLAALLAQPVPATPVSLANAAAQPDDLAYIIYTSGSTGDPKGVAITRANLTNFLLAMTEAPGIGQGDRLLAVTTISFDIHILELFVPLFVGAHVVVASREESVSQSALQTLINQHAITVMQATPASWRMLLGNGWQPAQPLKILVGGEALPKDLQPLMFAAASELWNLYGPTETTVWSLCHRIQAPDEKVYIGRPIRQTRIFVVDDQLQPVPAGTPGELLIGGAGVAPGYFGKQELTDQRFLQLPELDSGRVYRTGDRVVLHPDGLVEYLNRIDNQLKIRGYRIEPLEIETVLETLDGIRQAAVVASTFADNDKRLIAFYLGSPIDIETLRSFCVSVLPPHMVPQHFLPLDEFPMTANNKIDRQQLALLGAERVSQQTKKAALGARDDIDRSLIAVWEKALAIKGIDLDDNFFSLGGHSLLALQVAHEMNKATGMTFSAMALFEAPTIRQLRDWVGDQTGGASVVRLNATSTGDPVFCLCGVEIYQTLADQFTGERPVYGVFAQDEIAFIEAQQQKGQLEYSFDKLVDSYVEAIKRQGELSRMTLVGLSFGGLVALEAAKRFRKEGVDIASVVLLDTYVSTSFYRSVPKLIADLGGIVRRKGLRGLWRFTAKPSQPAPQAARSSPQGAEPPQRAPAQQLREKAFDRAALVYEKENNCYNFDALLIKARFMDFGLGRRGKYDYGLSPFIHGALTVKSVDTHHLGLVRSGAVAEVYKLIKSYEAGKR